MQMRLTRLIKQLRAHAISATWSVAEQGFSPLLMIALTPLLLYELGAEQFGLWMLVMAFVGMGQLTSIGAGAAVIKHISGDLTTGKTVKAIATVRAAVAIVLVTGIFTIMIASVAAPVFASTFFSKMGNESEVSNSILLGFMLMLVNEIDSVYSSVLRAAQRFDLSAKVEFFTRLAWGGGVVALAIQYKSAVPILTGVLVLSSIKSAIKCRQVNILLATNNCQIPLLDKVYILRVIDYGKWQWVQSLGGVLFSVADRLIIGSIYGANDLARYGICMQLAQYAYAIPAATMQIAFPWISGKIENGADIKDMNLYRYAFYTGVMCSLLAIIALPVTPSLLKIWLNSEFYSTNNELEIILLIAYGVLAFNVPMHYFLMALGKVKSLSLINLIAGVVSLLLSLLLSPFGLEWFASAKIIYGCIITTNFILLKKAER